MKKLFLSMTVIMLAVMLPLTANAATINAVTPNGKSEMQVGDIVEVTVKLDEKQVESMQFDLEYDNTKFQYVQESAQSDLNSTLSHEIEAGIVRVSVIDYKVDGKTDNEVTMKFKAKATGEKVDFKVVEGSVEVGKSTGKLEEKVKNPIVTIGKIEKKPDNNNNGGGGNPGGDAPQYVNDQGQVITALPKTGEKAATKAVTSIDGMYEELGNMQNVILYAFQTSETTLPLADIKAEFGDSITTTVTDIAKTGDTITVDGTTYTIIIYGDVNGDGKVSTYDALLAKRIKLGKITVSDYAREAANIEKSDIDTTAMQKFILRLRKTATDTILDKFPVKPELPETKVEGISVGLSQAAGNRFDRIVVATLESTTPGEALVKEIIKSKVFDANGNNVASMLTVEPATDASGAVIDGQFNLVLIPTVAGTYTVKPIVMANGQALVDENNEEITINVTEDYSVTDIELYAGNKLVETSATNPYLLKAGQKVDFSIKYLHKYSNGTILELNSTNKAILAEKIIFDKNDSSSILHPDATRLINENGTLVEYGVDGLPTQGATAHVNALRIQTNDRVSGTADLAITVKNDNGGAVALGIYVKSEAPEATGMKLDGTEYQKGVAQSHNLDLYTYDPNSDKVIANGSKFYTVLDVTILNQFYNAGDPTNTDGIIALKVSDVKLKSQVGADENNVLVINEVNNAADRNISFIRLKKVGNTYVEETNGTANIDAIGIAYTRPANTTCTDALTGDGTIQITYEGIEITINVAKKDTPVVTTNMLEAPKKEVVTCEHEKDEGTITKVATTEEVGTKVFKCTKCGEVLETVELPKVVEDTTANTNSNTNINTNTTANTTKPDTNSVNNDTANNTVVTKPDETEKDPEPVCEHEKDPATGVIVELSTCIKEGVAEYKCSKCGATMTENLGTVEHVYGEDGKCTTEGCTATKEVVTTPVENNTPTENETSEN